MSSTERAYERCGQIDWYSTVCLNNRTSCYSHYDRTEDIYCWVPNESDGIPTSTPSDYINASGGGGYGQSATNPDEYHAFAPAFAGIGDPTVNVRDELRCLTNNPTSGFTYKMTVYVDQPTPNSPSAITQGGVGHAYVGFEKTDDQSGAVYRRAVGFYPVDSYKASSAAVMDVPSSIRDNSGHDFDVSYTVEVNAQQFTNGVNAAFGWDGRDYSLPRYNCTNAVYDVFDAAGIGLPHNVSKVFIPVLGSAPDVIFLYSPGRLGQDLRSLKTNNPNFNITTNYNLGPGKDGTCN